MKYILSVIIPCYNCEKTLEKAVNSVLNQPCADDIEIILVDDGAKDGTPALCDKISDEHNNILVIHKENEGSGPARNSGIDAANGKYIAVLDSDDWWNIGVFDSALMNELQNDNFDIFGFSVQYVSPTLKPGKIVKSIHSEKDAIGYGKLKNAQIYHCSCLYLKDLLDKYHIRYPKIKTLEDTAFCTEALSVARSYKAKETVLYNYWINLNSFHHAMDDADIFESNLEGNRIVNAWAKQEGLDIEIDPRSTLSGIVKFLPRYCATHSFKQTLEWVSNPMFDVLNDPELLPWTRYQKSYALWNKNKKLFWLKNKILWFIPCKLKESRTKKPFVKFKNYIWYRLIKRIY